MNVDVLTKARDLLFLGKKVDYVTQHLNIARSHVIEAGFGAGLRYDAKADVMTARPAALDHDPEPVPTRSEQTGHVFAPRPKETAPTPAHLQPPKAAVCAGQRPDNGDEPAMKEPQTVDDDETTTPLSEPASPDEKPANNIPDPRWQVGDRVWIELLGERYDATVVAFDSKPLPRVVIELDNRLVGGRFIRVRADELQPIEQEDEPEPENPQPVAETGDEPQALEIGSIDTLLARVRFTDDPGVHDAARAVWSALRALQDAFTRAAALADVTAAKERADALALQAAQAQAEYLRIRALVDNTSSSRANAAAAAVREVLAAHGVDNTAVRAWARNSDVDCPPTGTVPRRVLNAWLDANHPNERN